MDEEEPIRIEITEELDLHTFRPNEVPDLLRDYLEECRNKGLLNVRVIHGKGTGTLRTTVHAALSKLDFIESYTWPAGALSGGWGATWAHLKPPAPEEVRG